MVVCCITLVTYIRGPISDT